MIFSLQELQKDPIQFDLDVPTGEIDFGRELRQVSPLSTDGRADLLEEHRGPHQTVSDIRVRGKFSGKFELDCARCLENVSQPLSGSFDLLYRPLGVETGKEEHSICTTETEIGYYQGGGLALEDVLREQVLLSVPARVLCQADCKGLCPRCGQNLNNASCTCEESTSDPRWNALGDLRSRLKS